MKAFSRILRKGNQGGKEATDPSPGDPPPLPHPRSFREEAIPMIVVPLMFGLFASTLFLFIGWIADELAASHRKQATPLDTDLTFGWDATSRRGRPMPAR
jgi:hypothetical protein